MAAAQQREFGPHPLTIIREAIAAARLIGVNVRIGSYGVQFTADNPGRPWMRDPRADGVDPIGAAILARQPQLEDIDEAAADAVNAPIPWVVGCTDGMQRRTPGTAWSSSIKAGEYAAGYQAGAWLRMQLLQKVGPPAGGGKV